MEHENHPINNNEFDYQELEVADTNHSNNHSNNSNTANLTNTNTNTNINTNKSNPTTTKYPYLSYFISPTILNSQKSLLLISIYCILILNFSICLLHCLLTSYFENCRIFILNSMTIFPLSIVILVFILLCTFSLRLKVHMHKNTLSSVLILTVFCIAKSIVLAYLNCLHIGKTVQYLLVVVIYLLSYITYRLGQEKYHTGKFLFGITLNLVFILVISLILYNFLHVLYCIIGIFIYFLYLLVNAEMILTIFNLEYCLSDWAFASLRMYSDVMKIFVFLGRLFGNKNH